MFWRWMIGTLIIVLILLGIEWSIYSFIHWDATWLVPGEWTKQERIEFLGTVFLNIPVALFISMLIFIE